MWGDPAMSFQMCSIRRQAMRYVVSAIAVGAAYFVRHAFSSFFGSGLTYITFSPAVMLAAVLGGLGPGLFATVLAALLAAIMILAPLNGSDLVGLVLFGAMGVFMSLVARLYHRARERAAAFEKELAVRKEQSRAAAETERQRQLLAVTLASIGDGVIVTDSAGRVTFLNGEAESLTGWSFEEAVGQPLASIFCIIHEETRQPVESPAEKVLRLGTTVGLANHTLLIARDGREIPIDDSGAPIRLEDGAVQGVVLVFRDFTQRRAAEEALTRAKGEWERTFDAAPDLIALIDPQHRILRSNKAMADHLGLNPEECVGQPCYRHVHGTDCPPEGCPHAQLLAEGHECATEIHEDRLGGDFMVSCTPLRDERGQIMASVHIAHDVTARKQAEVALLQRTERLALLSEAAAHLLAAGDPTVMVRELFDKVCAHLDVHAYFNFMVNETGDALRLDSYAGIPDRAAHLIEHLEFGQAICGTVAATRRPMHVPDVQHSLDAKVKLIKSYGIRAYCCHPLLAGERLLGTLSFGSRNKDRFDEDEVGFMRTVCHYVAMAKERLRLEIELRQHIESLAEADKRKDEFLAMLAHELRNPLAPVRNAMAVLRLAGPNEAILQRQRKIIERQVTHMARLLDDLLDVSRITQGKITLQRQPLALLDVLAHAAEVAAPVIEGRCHQLHLNLPPAGLRVEGDLDRLAQVVGNLLTNAAKYTPEGGQIWLEATRENGHAVVRVRDNGVGIAPEMLPRVFELFAQADRSLDRSQGGLGIGLTMVQSLVEMHGGRVEARSGGHGQGCEFMVSLPALPAEADETHSAQELPAEHGHEATVRRRVLVVDDVVDSAETLADLLRLWGHEVKTVHTGPEALAVVCRFLPEVILLDIGLPGMSGYEVARRMRAAPEVAGSTIVAMTGYGQDEDQFRSRAAGFHHHLIKPVDLDRLQALIQDGPGAM